MPATLADYEAPLWKAKKDKRRWCKGKVGREHDYQPVDDKWRQSNGWIVRESESLSHGYISNWAKEYIDRHRVCTLCRKERW